MDISFWIHADWVLMIDKWCLTQPWWFMPVALSQVGSAQLWGHGVWWAKAGGHAPWPMAGLAPVAIHESLEIWTITHASSIMDNSQMTRRLFGFGAEWLCGSMAIWLTIWLYGHNIMSRWLQFSYMGVNFKWIHFISDKCHGGCKGGHVRVKAIANVPRKAISLW